MVRIDQVGWDRAEVNLDEKSDDGLGCLLPFGIAVGVLFSLFVWLALGMAVSEFAATMFILGEIAFVAIVVAAIRWSNRSQK
jgi:hypothetical protein